MASRRHATLRHTRTHASLGQPSAFGTSFIRHTQTCACAHSYHLCNHHWLQGQTAANHTRGKPNARPHTQPSSTHCTPTPQITRPKKHMWPQETAFCYHSAQPSRTVPSFLSFVSPSPATVCCCQPTPPHQGSAKNTHLPQHNSSPPMRPHTSCTHTYTKTPMQLLLQTHSRDHHCEAAGLHSHHSLVHHVLAQGGEGHTTHPPAMPVPTHTRTPTAAAAPAGGSSSARQGHTYS